jgi:hypothetical protein
MVKIPIRYLPRTLSKKDKQKYKNDLLKSRKLYKNKNKYYTRKNVKSFTSKKSKHILNAEKMYNIKNMVVNKQLSRKTGCTTDALRQIVRKGMGAYYSSGSRPNQTPMSWGLARLASSITGSKASVVDSSILKKGCKKNSKAFILAKKAIKKYGKTLRKTPKINA